MKIQSIDKNTSVRERVLVLTSTFPRWKNDSEPAFVFELSRRMATVFDISILAPRTPGSKISETMGGLRIIRYPYFFRKWENLATHGGGILNRLKVNPLNYILVPFFLIGQILALVRILRKEHFDLIHAHWIIPQGLTSVLINILLRKQIPIICTSHGGDLYALRGKILQRLKCFVIDHINALAVVSEAMRKTVLDMGVVPDKIHVLSMGVDLKCHYTQEDSVIRSDTEILFVGRLVEKKGLPVLLKAMPEVIAKYPNAFLTVAGSGPMEQEILNSARRLGLSEKIHFLGMLPQSELPALYRRAALAVFPFVIAKSGDQEGLGLVVIEAMGCGCPVIVSDLPAIHDIVDHGKNGFFVETDNPKSLATAIIMLLYNKEIRFHLSKEARVQLEERFDWHSASEKYSRIYKTVFLKY